MVLSLWRTGRDMHDRTSHTVAPKWLAWLAPSEVNDGVFATSLSLTFLLGERKEKIKKEKKEVVQLTSFSALLHMRVLFSVDNGSFAQQRDPRFSITDKTPFQRISKFSPLLTTFLVNSLFPFSFSPSGFAN